MYDTLLNVSHDLKAALERGSWARGFQIDFSASLIVVIIWGSPAKFVLLVFLDRCSL